MNAWRASVFACLVAACAAALVAGCNDFSVPDGVQIQCVSGADCPDNYRCNAGTALCVPVDRADVEGPVVLSATADPAEDGLDGSGRPRPLTVRLVLDEAIVLTASSLVLVDPAGERAFDPLAVSDDATHTVTAVYTPAGSETQAVPLQVRATLEDALGNKSTSVLPVSVRFDFVPPAVLADPPPFVRVVAAVDNPLALEVDTLTQVANATADVQLGFVASELLAADGVRVFTTDGDVGVDFALVAAAGATVQLRGTVRGDATDGTWPLSAELTDIAGNTATVDLGVSVSVDVHPPAAPDVATAGRITLERAPWGRLDADAFAPDDFRVVGAPGAVEASSAVFVFRDAAGTREIGRMSANAGGAFGGADGTAAALLATADLRSVTVRSVDPAGNASAPVEVKETAWFATTAGRAVGDDLTNPHRLETAPIFAAGRAWDDLAELTDADGSGAPDGVVATTTGAGTWERVPTDAVDLTRAVDAAIGHDPLRGQTVLFGGAGQQNSGNFHDGGANACGGALDLLFVRERGGPWRSLLVDPVTGPPGMRGAHMSFDPDRERLVLIGDSGGAFQQWEWNGAAFERACVSAACRQSAPALASSFALASDPVRHSLVLARRGAAGLETWQFDGATWAQQCTQAPCSDVVPGVTDPVLAFSEGLGEVLLVGAGAAAEEVWSFDGARWLERCTDAACVAARPPARPAAAAAVDRSRDALVLFGGSSTTRRCTFNSLIPFFQGGVQPPNPSLADTWTFDGVVWTAEAPANIPPPRDHAEAVWEETEGRVLLVGGDDCDCATDIGPVPGITPGVLQDALSWDGVTWSTAVPLAGPTGFIPTTPTRSAHHAATHDAIGGGVVFAGAGLDRVFILDRDRFWRGLGALDPDVVRFGSALATPSLAGAASGLAPVLFSGTPVSGQQLGLDFSVPPRTQTLELGAAVDACASAACINAPPTPSAFGAATGDGARVLVFGGMFQGVVLDFATSATQFIRNELWAFDGATWSQQCTTSPCVDTVPAARMGAELTARAPGEVVLFGGANGGDASAALDDTWTFDGQVWTQLSPVESPPARVYAVQSFDPGRNAVVLTGGMDVFGRASTSSITTRALPAALDEVWELTGDSWQRAPEFDLERDGRPSSRFGAAAAWDNQRAGVVLHGGVPSPVLPVGGVQTDLSGALDDAWRWRSGADARPAQRFRPSLAAASIDGDQILDVTLVWRATGASVLAGAPTDALALFAWDGLSWRPLTLASCGTGCVQWTSSDDLPSTALSRLFTGTALRGNFVLTTAGVNGPAPSYAHVDTDAVELRVHTVRP